MSQTRRILPNADQGTNQMTPVPTVANHYQNLVEYPNDGDTSYLRAGTTGQREVFAIDVSTIADDDVIESVTLRAAVKGAADTSSFRVGFIIAGLDYFGQTFFPPVMDGYTEYSPSVWTTNPATGAPWTKTGLAAAFMVYEQSAMNDAALPRPRFSAFDGYATVGDLPERPTSTVAAVVSSALMSDPGKPTATAAYIGPTATPVVIVPTGTPSVITPDGDAA